MKTKRAAEFPINLSDWDFPELDDVRKILQKQVENAVRWALEEGNSEYAGPDAYLPIIFSPESDGISGKPPEDPLTVYIRIPLCSFSEESPSWSFSFGELVKNIIEEYTDKQEYKDSEDEKRDLLKLRDALLHLADMVGNAIDRC